MSKKTSKRSRPKRPAAKTKSSKKARLSDQEYRRLFGALDGIVLSESPGITWDTFNSTLKVAIDAEAGAYADVVETYWRLNKWPEDESQLKFIRDHVRTALEIGFRIAVSRYREHLEQVPELQRRRDNAAARSQAGNASKRKAPVAVGGSTMPREERDAAMAAEYVALLKRMKPTPACQLLADKYGFESWQGVDSAIKRFHKRAGQ